jgi:Isochorismatase family
MATLELTPASRRGQGEAKMTKDLGVWSAEDCALGGLHTEICLTFATAAALKDGYDVLYVTDAVVEAEKRAASAHGGH